MKFTHYNYKCSYFLPFDNTKSKFLRKSITSNQRYQINLGYEYHTSYINIFSLDPEIANFDLGVDFSHPNHKAKNRRIERLYLNFIIKGKGLINGKPFCAGQLYYTLPLETHTIESDPDDPYVSVWISLRGTYINHIVSELLKKSREKILPIEHRTDIMKFTKTLLYEMNLGETSTSYLKSLLSIYLSYIYAPSDELEYPEIFATKKITKLIKESKAYIRKNLKTVTVTDMAAAQHYNTKYFSRVFTEAMGIKPFEYIIDCKMEWAKNSLTYSTLSIDEIAEALGYEHRNSFTVAFQKKYGCTPAAYKKKIKEDKNIDTIT